MNAKMKQILGILTIASALTGCHTDMWTQAKVTPFDEDETGLFKDGASNRPLVKGAVAQGWAKLDEPRYTGYEGDKFTDKFPKELDLDGEIVKTDIEMMKVLKRGKERYHIYCSHCHGESGDGKGMISQRGLVLARQPATYHTDRLKNMPIGYFYDVITSGYGIMYSQSSRVKPDDRWAIVAYLRVLQESQASKEANLSLEDKKALEDSKNPPAAKDKMKSEGAAN